MSTIEVRVARKACEAEGICSYELVRADGAPLPPFEAGAHIDVHLDGGLVRQYSLCNAPGETGRYLIAVLHEAASRGGSRAMHELVDTGSPLHIGPPRNHFPLAGSGRSLLLAGGIGVTPILAMAEALAAAGAEFELHYCARSPQRAAFRERIGASAFKERVHFHYDDGAAAQRLDLERLLGGADGTTELYVCGPQGFIAHVLGRAKEMGWPAARLHVEYFGAAHVDNGADQAFEVKLAASGKVVAVAAGQTVIEALAAHGVDIPYSCGEGVCGTCLTRVLDGVPEHRDLYLTEEEQAANDQFTPCCSRARTPQLVLDL
jgi:vanillate O-demethylase ferredoxin subunit